MRHVTFDILMARAVTVSIKGSNIFLERAELRRCVKIEVAVLGSRPL